MSPFTDQKNAAFVTSFCQPISMAGSKVSSFRGKCLSSFIPVRKVCSKPEVPLKRCPKMISSLISIFQVDEVDIPQNDQTNKDKRANSVSKARERYNWTQESIEGASMIKGFAREAIEIGWVEQFIPIFTRVVINKIVYDSGELTETAKAELTAKISNFFLPFLTKVAANEFTEDDQVDVVNGLQGFLQNDIETKGGTIDEHKKMFNVIKLDDVTNLNQFLWDDIFGWYRVAGPNPMRLIKVKDETALSNMFPEFTDTILKGIDAFGGDTIADMLQENRLYSVSYPEFQGVPTGNDSSGNKKENYLYAPDCILGVPKSPSARQTVLPLAIRCDQNKNDFPMYTANSDHTPAITWLAAKATVQVADSVMHEAVYHLARTHLLVGIFICSTHRALPDVHPIHRLLKCHSYGTAFINNLATIALINPGGIIDTITAPDIFDTRNVSADGVNGESSIFNDWFPDVDLHDRGVINSVLKFPYRDDALKLWDAIVDWVTEYLSAYYKSDSDVTKDYELTAWCAEISDADKGNLHGFGDNGDGKVKTKNYLIRAVAMVIFTATAQHAAVNFTQSAFMQFSPAMPLSGYAPAMNSENPFSSTDDLSRKMFPALDKSYEQLQTAEIIGVLNYGQLGKYGTALDFAPDSVRNALGKFTDRLGIISADIRQRNITEKDAGLPPYNYLAPENIPKSINI